MPYKLSNPLLKVKLLKLNKPHANGTVYLEDKALMTSIDNYGDSRVGQPTPPEFTGNKYENAFFQYDLNDPSTASHSVSNLTVETIDDERWLVGDVEFKEKTFTALEEFARGNEISISFSARMTTVGLINNSSSILKQLQVLSVRKIIAFDIDSATKPYHD